MRLKRHRHTRKKLEGTSERPRLCVFRSNRHIYGQVIDDVNGRTLVSASTRSPELRDALERTGDVAAAAQVGSLIGRKCMEKGLEKLVFDRGGFRYHGRVRALADGVRETFESEGKSAFK